MGRFWNAALPAKVTEGAAPDTSQAKKSHSYEWLFFAADGSIVTRSGLEARRIDPELLAKHRRKMAGIESFWVNSSTHGQTTIHRILAAGHV